MVSKQDLLNSVKEIGPEFLKRNSKACDNRSIPENSINDLHEHIAATKVGDKVITVEDIYLPIL